MEASSSLTIAVPVQEEDISDLEEICQVDDEPVRSTTTISCRTATLPIIRWARIIHHVAGWRGIGVSFAHVHDSVIGDVVFFICIIKAFEYIVEVAINYNEDGATTKTCQWRLKSSTTIDSFRYISLSFIYF